MAPPFVSFPRVFYRAFVPCCRAAAVPTRSLWAFVCGPTVSYCLVCLLGSKASSLTSQEACRRSQGRAQICRELGGKDLTVLAGGYSRAEDPSVDQHRSCGGSDSRPEKATRLPVPWSCEGPPLLSSRL